MLHVTCVLPDIRLLTPDGCFVNVELFKKLVEFCKKVEILARSEKGNQIANLKSFFNNNDNDKCILTNCYSI